MSVIPQLYPATLERNPADFTTPKPSLLSRFGIQAAAAPYIKALDVSKYQEQHEVDYAKAYAAGYRLVIIRATQGTSYPDPMFEWHWKHALDAGFYIMLYHYFLDHLDGADQADYFLSQTLNARVAIENRTAAWNDIERNPYNMAVTVSARCYRAQAWYRAVAENITHVGAYSSPALWNELMDGDTITKYGDGWLAHWTSAAAPTPPTGWTMANVRIWQTGVYPTYPWVEPVPGVTGTVDVDRWLGDEKSLKDYLGYVDAPPPPPPPMDEIQARVEALEVAQKAALIVLENHIDRIAAVEISHKDLANDIGMLASDLAALKVLATQHTTAIEYLGERYDDLDNRLRELEAAPPTPPTPQPSVATFRVVDGQALARCVAGYNAAGRPIMSIFPRDNAPVSERIKWVAGTLLKVNPTAVTADGGGKYFALVDYPGKYVRLQDGTLTVG